MATTNGVNGVHPDVKPDYDTLVIGAGFAGLRMIHELRKQNVTFRVLEAGTGVGGTWYWNRYPGARTDSESWVYILNFSKELNDEWTWKERFPRQPEVLEYLNHVADRFDMRKDIQFKTRVKSAHYDEGNKLWKLTTETGETLTSRVFVSASGLLSVGRELPDVFKGTEKFKGESYKSYAWPKEEVNFKGKRVGVIGTGATSVQIIPMIAHEAAKVTVFQRKANFVLPARNYPLTAEQQRDIKANYEDIWSMARKETFGMHWVDSKRLLMESDEKTIKRVLEAGWEGGGFRFFFETFADLMTSQKANDIASDFVRDKIRAVVHDEETAELLCPDHALMAKRPPLGHHYFETFNRKNVQLVSIKDNPIKEITETGVKLEKEDSRAGTDEFDFDIIIYAIGFDAVTGALVNMDVRGKDNRSLGEEWNKQLETFLGICVEGYPNLFMLSAPQSPFANLPLVLDNTGDWIGQTMAYMKEHDKTTAEPTSEAQAKWCKALTDVYEGTVLPQAATKAGSWYIGANIPGKRVAPLFWFGGVVSYFKLCDEEIEKGFPSMIMS